MLRYSSPMYTSTASSNSTNRRTSEPSCGGMPSHGALLLDQHMASNDFELYHAQSNASSYSSSYPSSNYSYSSFGSYDSGSFEASSYDSGSYEFTTPPPIYCPPDLNPQFAPQYFSSPVQGTWPTPPAQVSPVEEIPYPPLETHYTPCETAKPVKPYVCECGRAFTRPADLKRHESSVHNPVFQDCPVQGCIRKDSNGFPRRDHLIEHLRSYHHLNVPKRRAATKRVAKAA
ncbi:unnamed protein product [Aspergillus oryzae RIB40]|uniref:DNA, SC011 n=1 Tax=Aspergillus oryzae (strain ATCC 42149 / RIB 40) TaxID=510516 RepID=Q2U0D7_ASPOR|nr:unnamed protein product [Aspergillus oryzae RIB40]BAE64978.1 unnamed protein product [Aspergillus oryzae RIB40]